MLVAAVLGPKQREDRKLEMIWLALEQLDDSRELSVGEAEGSMERLVGDRAQVCHSNRERRRRPPRWEEA